jgi:hypothetical protein
MNLLAGTFFGRNLLVGTFGSLEPFSQELFSQERFGRNLLVGNIWQEPIVIPLLPIYPFTHKLNSS